MNPPLVLADEPTGNLNTQTSDEIVEVLRRFNAQARNDASRRYPDRIEGIVDGRIVRDHPVERR